MAGLGSAAWASVPAVPAAAVPSCRPKSLSSPLPPGRLASLRNRDLTLGGALKKPKKTFEPNVHALRKNKEELKEELHIAPKKGRKQRNEKRRESGGRKKERRQTIQSHSIFEQGPAETKRRTVCRGATDLIYTHPVCRSVKKESEEDQDEILHKLRRDDFIDDPALRNDDRLKPIQLPLRQCSRFTQSHSSTGLLDCLNCKGPAGAEGKAGLSRTEPPTPAQPSLAELFHDLSLSAGEQLFFMQLPDCLPGMASGQKVHPTPPSTAETAGRKKDKCKDRSAAEDGCAVLSHRSEGFLGKLLIRKSGRVELKMDGISMDISEGAAFSFLQELVSVQLSGGRTGDMIVLGNVEHKLVLSPDFQTLLTQATTQQSKSSR
ncbi:DNA-directed RNA polymerase III subunit RPC4 isoform X3 [Gouania willdenowi]|uniref:DNA-directed RNA polymerase III subunit RPC4-like n=1 Tax=Gouania willdenowi TaxID=441366 RepID=A0A8C5N7I0_GOUWI|nr:DNA-directed RNA polymerase III subunit RPC4-like isoform X3 [Gouania willdenowi]